MCIFYANLDVYLEVSYAENRKNITMLTKAKLKVVIHFFLEIVLIIRSELKFEDRGS